MTVLLEKILKDFPEKHYTTTRLPISEERLKKAADAYSEFLEVPDELKFQFKGMLIPGEPKSSIGFEEKDRKKGNKDDKWFFHYNPALKRIIPELFQTKDRRVDKFLDLAEEVYDGVEIIAARLADALESITPGITQKFFPSGQDRLFYLRFLAYKPTEGKLANAHYDQSPWTVALAESRGGLRIGAPDKLEEVVRTKNEAVLFCGPNVKNMVPEQYHTILKPGFHDVIEKSNAIDYKPGIPRWAIVAFVWPHGLQYMDFKEAHPTAQKEGFQEGKLQHEKGDYK